MGETSPLRTHPTVKADWQEPMSAYGNTETLTLNTAHHSGTPRAIVDGNHGFPLPGNTIRIVDPMTGKVLARNESGEIAVKGPDVDARLSARGRGRHVRRRRLLPHGRWRLRRCGRPAALARALNDIIKTGGANVSPLEIDAVLAECPGVKIAATVGVPHDTLGEMVVACVVPRERRRRRRERRCARSSRKRLSSYKVPRRVLFVEESDLTLTASNKVKTAPLRELAARRLADS